MQWLFYFYSMIDHDYEWKLLLERLFEEAILFFMPELHAQIDFNIEPIFLEKEFQNLIAEKFKDKKKSVDKLAKVRLKNGNEQWVLIHIEVQSYFEKNFARRIFIYYYLITEKYGNLDLTTLAVYTGAKIPKQFNKYERDCFGTELSFKFNSYKVRDQKEADLLANDNPFALAILANWYLLKSKNNVPQRFAYKRKLIELAQKKGLSRREIHALFRFIRYIVELPKPISDEFDNGIVQILNERKMTIPTEQDKKFAYSMIEIYLGEPVESYFRRLVEEERLKGEQKAQQERLKTEQKAKQERYTTIKNMIEKSNLPVDIIADLIEGASLEEVLKIKETLDSQS